jgi:hypothetical protein
MVFGDSDRKDNVCGDSVTEGISFVGLVTEWISGVVIV